MESSDLPRKVMCEYVLFIQYHTLIGYSTVVHLHH